MINTGRILGMVFIHRSTSDVSKIVGYNMMSGSILIKEKTSSGWSRKATYIPFAQLADFFPPAHWDWLSPCDAYSKIKLITEMFTEESMDNLENMK